MKRIRGVIIVIVILSFIFSFIYLLLNGSKNIISNTSKDSITWIGSNPQSDLSIQGTERDLILYGQELIAHTSTYLGPKGKVAKLTNGMNCQNCHLNAGNKPWGNNYGGVFSTYPKFRERSGSIETIYKRVSDCMQRSLNGKALDSNSKEFLAMYAYIKYLGKNVQKGIKPKGTGIEKISLLNRAADPYKGHQIYINKCQICHGDKGQGQMMVNNNEYLYPPVWGENSYNDGAGLYRISNLAGYLKNNMPYLQTTHEKPALTNEQCWDLAAFINSQPRPHMDQKKDWPNVNTKPFDYAWGPYADTFTETQHKYGPYQIIINNKLAK